MTTASQLEPLQSTERDCLEDGTGAIELPDELTSAQAKLVFLYLTVRGTVTVDELGSALGLPKLALFSILQTLARYDLVVREGDVVSPA